jgi:PPM family protein phosphatase
VGKTSHLNIAGLSHPGEQRDNNEDSFALESFQPLGSTLPSVLAIVADGIGGHQAGEVASAMTVDTITDQLRTNDASDPVGQLRTAIKSAGRAVVQAADQSPDQRGMGSTVAVAWVIGRRLYTAHVGDSRIYLLRSNAIRQISVDHTWVQEALDNDVLTPEQARVHPHAHVLRLAIGSAEPPDADLRIRLSKSKHGEEHQGFKLQPQDQILLCSDGLTDLVEAHEIEAALVEQKPADAVRSLVSLARARGGHDNITVVIVAIPDESTTHIIRRRKKRWGLVLISVLILILIALATALIVWRPANPIIGPSPPIEESISTATIALEKPDSQSNSQEIASATPLPSNTPASTPIPRATTTAIALPTIEIN